MYIYVFYLYLHNPDLAYFYNFVDDSEITVTKKCCIRNYIECAKKLLLKFDGIFFTLYVHAVYH